MYVQSIHELTRNGKKTWQRLKRSFGVPGINPGIRNTVALFNHLGYDTTDSGDGKTRDFECDREVGYVVIMVPPEKNLVEVTDSVARMGGP